MEDYENYKKPYYTIYQNSGCASEIYVNDVLVTSWLGKDTEGSGQMGGDIPINHAVLESGTYKVVGKMYPRHGKKTLTKKEYLGLDFYIAEADPKKWKQTRMKFHPKAEQPWSGLSDSIEYPYFEVMTEITVELPFVLDGWQNSIDLTSLDEEKLFEEVVAFYTQIYAVVKTHNVSKFLELSKEKVALHEKAFYFGKEDTQRFEDEAAGLFAEQLEVMPLRPQELKLLFMGEGKLVSLVHRDNRSAIQFKNPDPEAEEHIELDIKIHMRDPEQGFTII